MSDDLQVTPRLVIPARELSWRFSRSGGPGGQHANTSDTRVELSFDVAASSSLCATHRTRALARLAARLVDGVITVSADERRSQLQNREAARDRLAEVLRAATSAPPRTRRPTRPTKSAERKRIEQKKRRGTVKKLRQTPTDD